MANAFGSVTASDLMLASPERVQRSKRSGGSWLRAVFLLPPSWRTVIFGLKGRPLQLSTWNGELKSAVVPSAPIPCDSTENCEQFVGLMVKFGFPAPSLRFVL